jgi:hypothetical protein
MLSESQKKEYMEIMHEYSAVRARLEELSNDSTGASDITTPNSAPVDPVAHSISDGPLADLAGQAVNAAGVTDDARLAALRKKLNL